MPLLSIKNVSHSFSDNQVLKDVNLEVEAGEIVAIMGSSGGGKSTLLKVISGLLVPTEGDVIVGDVSTVQDPEGVRSKLGLVFQSAALFDSMSVYENVAFGLTRKPGIRGNEVKDRVNETLAQVGLPESNDLMPAELSGGMRKRVGLARALVMEPEVLLYDEPTSGLDPITAYAIDSLIVETRDRLGVTSIVVSHDVSSVFRVADRIAFLEGGELTFVGSEEAFREIRTGAIHDLVAKARAEEFLSS
ncbi:MAG: ATP-binding cassette domain-containing protein [Armatimonadetes bacterium]|nr:ATP-binding cassette domain-containing protein [Armatimonadota bacterium]